MLLLYKSNHCTRYLFAHNVMSTTTTSNLYYNVHVPVYPYFQYPLKAGVVVCACAVAGRTQIQLCDGGSAGVRDASTLRMQSCSNARQHIHTYSPKHITCVSYHQMLPAHSFVPLARRLDHASRARTKRFRAFFYFNTFDARWSSRRVTMAATRYGTTPGLQAK